MAKRTIIGFRQDDEGHWIAELSCGHRQHVRHTPPWMNRPWVLTAAGRAERLGLEMDCRACDEASDEASEAPSDEGQTPGRE